MRERLFTIAMKLIQNVAITLYSIKQKYKIFFVVSVISNNKSFIFQNLKVVGSLGRKFDFFSHSGFEIQSDSQLAFDTSTSQIR